jgi:zinc D-Ala-D-Ala dipeptidase
MPMRIASAILGCLLATSCATRVPDPLPSGFVRLSQHAPTIAQDIRYFGATNFIGRRIAGYLAAECIATRETGDALLLAQQDVARDGLTLVVFDCYRPARAVADFMQWTQTAGPVDPVWRPAVAKDRLVPDGYIAARSGHSRGSTVDLALARLVPSPGDAVPRESPCARYDADTLDFGTPFDCFDRASATAFEDISPAARVNRDRLVSAMTAAGFRNYAAEWWHFTLVAETNKTVFYDFPVTRRPIKAVRAQSTSSL